MLYRSAGKRLGIPLWRFPGVSPRLSAKSMTTPGDYIMKLTAKTISALDLPDGKADAIYFDSDVKGFGFRLRRSSGKTLRSWVLCYRRPDGGGARRMTLGEAAALTAEQARAAAEKMRAKVVLGEDPQGDKAAQRTAGKLTVRALIEEYQADRKGDLRAATMRDVTRYLTDDSYFKALHPMPIERVSRRDVAACLTRIKREHGTIVAGAARAKLQAFFVWAMRQGYVEANPVIGTEQPKRAVSRERVLTDDELVRIWNAATEMGYDYGAIIRLLILTGARRAEIGGMAWSELELDGPQPTWTLPSARSKNHKPHTLPLLPMAANIIRSVPRLVSRDQLFGSRSDNGFAGWDKGKQTLDARSRVTGWTPHDLRRTFSTKLHDDPLAVEPHIVEALLNHSGHRAGPAGAYNKAAYRRRMVAALALWEDHIRALVTGGERRVLNFQPASAP